MNNYSRIKKMITKILRTENEIMADWKNYNIPLLSISCLTYNHEKYIEDALEGFLIQKTDFPFEIVIHDDASTDNTANVIREYETAYPNIIKAVYQKENQFSKGVNISATYNFPRMRGKYVAICDGDDFWTDSNKLSGAVKFLEKHNDYIGCYHNVDVINEKNEFIYNFIKDAPKKDLSGVMCQLKYNCIITLSLVFKNIWKEKLANIHNELGKNSGLIGDYQLKCLLLSKGKIKYFDKVMGVYRWQSKGVNSYSSLSNTVRLNSRLNAVANSLKYLYPSLSYEEIIGFKKVIGISYFSLIYYNLTDGNIQQIIPLFKDILAKKMFNRTFFYGYEIIINKIFNKINSIFFKSIE